jgi:hypothetical protein
VKRTGTTLGGVIIYARRPGVTAEFYCRHFGFTAAERDGLIELTPPEGGARILVHQAATSVKLGQVGVKLVFDVADVEAFKAQCAKDGLAFGAIHAADGYQFANAKDPDKNSVSISSRAFRKPA